MKENIILDKSQLVEMDFSSYVTEVEEIINILTAIVKTSQRKS